MKYARIIGTGSFFPEKTLTNFDLEKMVETSNDWIVERTGIHNRHIAEKDETPTEMAYKATLNALDMAGIEASDIDGIIFASVTPDYILPASAVMLQHKLGISGKFSFDLNAACSGIVYCLHLADALIKAGKHKTILIVGSEKLSCMTDYRDRGTCILFGDGAGALIVQADDEPGILSTSIHADGAYGDILYMHGMGSVFLSNRDNMVLEEELLKMRGNEVFRLAVRAMAESSAQAVRDSGISPEEIGFLVPHQANIRIVEAVAKRFDMGMDKVLINLDRRGNCSSATIPTVLDENIRNGKVKKGDNLVMTAFGGGLTWGSAVVRF